VYAGFIDDMCFVRGDRPPVISDLFLGEVCVVSDSQPCDDVHIIAENFVVNSNFTCRIMVCISIVVSEPQRVENNRPPLT